MSGYNFTDRVRKVLQMAREESARLGHEYVGTEHILLGLILEGDGVAVAVLTNLGVDCEGVCGSIEAMVKKGSFDGQSPDLPYTSRAKKVLELAMSEARELNHAYVGTEHLLLGLLREKKGLAAQALNEVGVTLESTRAEVLRILGVDPTLGEVATPWPGYLDHAFKTAIALIELHRVRFDSYPDAFDNLRFLGPFDQRILRVLRYQKLADGYALHVDAPAGTKPDLAYPADFWRGLGLRQTNVDRSPPE